MFPFICHLPPKGDQNLPRKHFQSGIRPKPAVHGEGCSTNARRVVQCAESCAEFLLITHCILHCVLCCCCRSNRGVSASSLLVFPVLGAVYLLHTPPPPRPNTLLYHYYNTAYDGVRHPGRSTSHPVEHTTRVMKYFNPPKRTTRYSTRLRFMPHFLGRHASQSV